MRTEFDYSMMSTYMTCRRKYDYRYNQHLVGKAPQTAPEFGKGIHAALDSWWVDHDVEKAIAKFRATFTENPEDTKRTYKMGEWILGNYHSTYENQPMTLIATEQSFDLPLPNGNRLIGRIDKLIGFDDYVWVMDHKTTSMLGPSYFKMAEPNLQFTGYVWAARQLGHQAVGVYVDAILVADGLLPGPKKNRNLTPLSRYDVYRSDEHIKEWLETVTRIQQDIRLDEHRQHWTPNFDACTYYGECPYRRICKEDRDVRERVIQADYRQKVWDPRLT